jgi:amino acid transporter
MEGMFYMYAGYDGRWWPLARILTSETQIDQIFNRLLPRRIRHLPVLGYSTFFLLIGTSYTNSYGFAKNFLTGFSPTTKDPYKLNQHGVKVTAAIVITVVSFVLYHDKTLALRLNRLFAVYKVLLISIGCIIAFVYSAYRAEGIQWSDDRSGWKVVTGFLQVLYAYQGWETPFFVRVSFSQRKSEGRTRV